MYTDEAAYLKCAAVPKAEGRMLEKPTGGAENRALHPGRVGPGRAARPSKHSKHSKHCKHCKHCQAQGLVCLADDWS